MQQQQRFRISGPHESFVGPYGSITHMWCEYLVTDTKCGQIWQEDKGELFIPNSLNIKEYSDERCSISVNDKVYKFYDLINAVQWAVDYLTVYAGN
jgi:hypothetical protein